MVIKYNETIKPSSLISTYHRFLRNPNKVFILNDFKGIQGRNTQKTHIYILKTLKVIEQVKILYKSGNSKNYNSSTKGYKLNHNLKEINKLNKGEENEKS